MKHVFLLVLAFAVAASLSAQEITATEEVPAEQAPLAAEPSAEEPAEEPAEETTSAGSAINRMAWPGSIASPLLPSSSDFFEIELGVQPVSTDEDSSKFDEYRDVPSGAVLPFFHVYGEGVYDYSVMGTDIGEQDQRYGVEVSRGPVSLGLSYDQIPHRFGNNGRTLLERVTRNSWQVSNTLQQAHQNAIAQQFAANRAGVNYIFLRDLVAPSFTAANVIDIELLRERVGLQLDFSPGMHYESAPVGESPHGPYSLDLSYKAENRTGDRQAGTSFGFGNVVETPEPIEYRTQDLELSGEMPLSQGLVRASIHYNDFSNAIDGLLFDNPFRATDSTDPNAYQAPGSASIGGAARGQVALPPDSQAVNASVGGLWKLPANSRLNGNVSVGRWTQKNQLLPFTTNTAITVPFNASDPNTLPVQEFDGAIDTVNGFLSFTSRPLPKLSINARYRVHDMNNDSERVRFEQGYVRFDAVFEDIPRITVPYGSSNNRGDVSASYDLGPVTIEGAYRHETMERTFRETEQTTEDALKLSADFRPISWATVRLSYELGERDFDHYDPDEAEHASFLEPGPATNQPSLRRFDQAKRDVNRTSALIQLTPFGNLGITLHYLGNSDDYTETSLGLIEFTNNALTAEVDYSPGETWGVYGFVTRENWSSFQRGRQSGAAPSTNPLDDWTADINDDVDSIGVGGNYSFVPDRVVLKLFGRYQRVNGFNDLESPPGGTPDFAVDIPNFDDTSLWSGSAELEYSVNTNWSLSVGSWLESYEIDDAQTVGVTNYMPGGFFLAPNDTDYNAAVAYVRASYRR